jgi:DNA-binding LacI/PurR family transcriptional regulator
MTTIIEVAQKAQVSITTVSRVLNKSAHKVNSKTREKVLAAIAELDYHPNALAQSLLKKRSMTIGIIIPDIANPYYAEIVRGIQDKADGEGYSVLIENTDRKPDRIIRTIYDMREKNVDGIIFTGGIYKFRNLLPIMKNLSSRAVVIGRHGAGLPSVRIDNIDAMFLAVSHLAGLGRRNMAFVNGDTHSSTMMDRLKGFQRAMKHYDCKIPSEFISQGMLTPDGGYTRMKELLCGKKRPDAVILANDQMAFGALKAIREAGLSVPGDIALIGFDDVALCSFFEPSISSIEIPRYKLGAAAMEMLLCLINGEKMEKTRWFKVKLNERRSTLR